MTPRQLARFEAKYIIEPNSSCWLWTDSLHSQGYGLLWIAGAKKAYAHRLSYEHFVGPVAAGQYVLHRCDVRSCVNPSHLFVGSHAENMLDMARKERARSTTLSAAAIREIGTRTAAGESQSEIARRYGVSRSAIWRIVHGLAWTHVECECGAALFQDHDCPLMPSCDGDEMHPLDIITVDEACS